MAIVITAKFLLLSRTEAPHFVLLDDLDEMENIVIILDQSIASPSITSHVLPTRGFIIYILSPSIHKVKISKNRCRHNLYMGPWEMQELLLAYQYIYEKELPGLCKT